LLWGISRDGRAFPGGASAAEMAGIKMAARGRGGKTRNSELLCGPLWDFPEPGTSMRAPDGKYEEI